MDILMDKRTKEYKEYQKKMKELEKDCVNTSAFQEPEPTQLDSYQMGGLPCKYVHFHQPVPPYENREPVSEFKIIAKTPHDAKYQVDSMVWTIHGLFWKCRGETNTSPLANIKYCRFIV